MTYEIEKNIKRLKQQIADEEAKLEALKGLNEVEVLAITLHDKLCKANHTDGCGWFYFMENGVPTWGEHSQQRFLHKARCIDTWCRNKNLTIKDALDLIGLIAQ